MKLPDSHLVRGVLGARALLVSTRIQSTTIRGLLRSSACLSPSKPTRNRGYILRKIAGRGVCSDGFGRYSGRKFGKPEWAGAIVAFKHGKLRYDHVDNAPACQG